MYLLILIYRLANLYSLVIVIAAFTTWISLPEDNPGMRFLRAATEPVLRPFRRLVPPEKTGGLDISPVLAILAIQLCLRLLFW
jgi:YggT family protein